MWWFYKTVQNLEGDLYLTGVKQKWRTLGDQYLTFSRCWENSHRQVLENKLICETFNSIQFLCCSIIVLMEPKWLGRLISANLCTEMLLLMLLLLLLFFLLFTLFARVRKELKDESKPKPIITFILLLLVCTSFVVLNLQMFSSAPGRSSVLSP